MIVKISDKPRFNTYKLNSSSHKEFREKEIIGEPLGLGVRNPSEALHKYIIREGYSYMWEYHKLCDSTSYYRIWLVYPAGKRPNSIEIGDYEEDDIIDAEKYNIFYKTNIKKESSSNLENENKNIILCSRKLDLDNFSDYLIENKQRCFNLSDKKALLNILEAYFK